MPAFLSCFMLDPLIGTNQSLSFLKSAGGKFPAQQHHVHYASPAHDRRFVSEHTEGVLRSLMASAGITEVWITSTVRDETDQARVMLNNLKAERSLKAARAAETDDARRALLEKQIAKQHVGYAKPGQKVLSTAISSLDAGEAEDKVIEKMIETIRSVGLTSVTKHAATSGRNTVDISARRIRKSFGQAGHDRFIDATKAAVADGTVARFGWAGGPKGNGKLFHDGACFHIEVEQPASKSP